MFDQRTAVARRPIGERVRRVPPVRLIAPRPRTPGLLVMLACAAILSSCTLTPDGAEEQQLRLTEAGKPYEPKFQDRVLPEFPDAPTWQQVLQRAFLVNGDLEAAYFTWKSSFEGVDIASAYPNANISLGFDYMFSSERMKSFNRTTTSVGFDPSMNLELPMKVEQAGKVALAEARVAGAKFRVAKFELQRVVLRTWADYTLQARGIALRSEDLSLRRVLVDSARGAVGTGRRVRDAQVAELDWQTAQNELHNLQSEHDATRAKLNSMLGRPPGAVMIAPLQASTARDLPVDDEVMFRAAADVFPEVAAMAREVEGRADALELARLRWIPDISPTFSFTGAISQSLGAMVTLPTTIVSIRGRIRQAEADLRASEAVLRQRSSDRVGEYFALVLMYKNAHRQIVLFEKTIMPALERLSAEQGRAYEAGAALFNDVVESRRMLLDARQLIAVAQAEMDKAVVEIECCLGVDIETLEPGAAQAGPSAGERNVDGTVNTTSGVRPAQKESSHGH